MPSRTAQVFLDDERGGVFGFGPIVFIDWRHASSTAPLEAADRAVEVAVAGAVVERRLCYVHRVAADSPVGRAKPEVRAAALVHFDKHDASVFAAAIALEATGFHASVIRSAAAGVLLLRPTPIKTRVFDDVVDSLQWLAALRPERPTFEAQAAIVAFAAHNLLSPFPFAASASPRP